MPEEDHDPIRSLSSVVRILAAAAIAVGGLSLIGWLTGTTSLIDPVPTEPPLKFNTGLCFLLSGVSVLLLVHPHPKTPWRTGLALLLSSLVLLIGVGTAIEHVYHLNLGIDQMAIRDSQEKVKSFMPGRMSLNASVYLFLLGLSLVLVDRRSRFLRDLQQWAAIGVWMMTTGALIGYGYGFKELYNYSSNNPLTFPSAIAFYCLAIATFLLRPQAGPAAIYCSPTVAGAIARALGLAGMLLPGIALIDGLNMRTTADLFIVALLLFIGFPLGVWAAAQTLEKTERERQNIFSKFERFMSNLPGLSLITDASGKVVYANGDLQKKLAVTAGNEIWALLPESTAEAAKEAHKEVLQTGQRVDTILPTVSPTGEKEYFFVVEFPINAPEGGAVGSVIIDITKQKHDEQLIRELNDALEARVKELLETNAELEATRDAALAAAQIKTEFLSKISHELRTPLAGVLGMLELVKDERMSKDGRESVGMAEESAQQLLEIVNDLLDFSDFDSGKAQLHERDFNVAKLVDGVASAIKQAATRKSLLVITELEPQLPLVIGDEEKLRKVLLHLSTNAVKFTQQGCVLLRVTAGDSVNNLLNLQFSISDTGIGISPEQRKKLFLPFSQADNSHTRRYGGTGLGLVITKNLVELMGGSFGFSSIQDKGSTFWCNIPFAVSEKQPKTIDLSPEVVAPLAMPNLEREACSRFVPVLAGGEVLIVADNDMLLKLSEQQLESLGLKATFAKNGQEAWEAVSTHKYKAVLVDDQVSAPIDVERNIRKADDERKQHTPIIAMTAVDHTDAQSRKDTAVDAVLAKPVSTEHLAETLAKLIAANRDR